MLKFDGMVAIMMVDEDGQKEELRMIRESRLYYPDSNKTKKSVAKSAENFDSLLKESWKNPSKFWSDVANELSWDRKWDKVMEGTFPHFKFFVNGVMNPCYNLIDRHLEEGADNRLALIWEGENEDTKFYTYKMLHAEVCKFANVLKRLGLNKGDTVAIFLPNLAEVVIAVLACYRLGILFNTIFSGFFGRSLRDRLIRYGPKAIITADGTYRRGRIVELKSKVDEAIKGIETVEKVIVYRRIGDIEIPMEERRDLYWRDLMKSASSDCPPEPMEANEPGMVFYTSGTTGTPKGIVHSSVAFVVNNYVYARYHMDHHPNDVFWCTADIGWLTSHIWGIVGALVNGVTTIFYEGAIDHPKPDRFYRIVDKYRVNKIFTAPTLIRMLMRYGEGYMKPYDLSCIDVVTFVGEPLNPEAWHWTYEVLGKNQIYVNNTWGQTETAGCPLASAAWITPMKPGSCGIQFLGADMDVVDERGNSVPDGTPGRLVMRRPIPMCVRTLWNEPERYIQEYFTQVKGCYYTFDQAVRDEDGHFWVLGRLDDVINVAGHRLSTMEIESAITGCDGVAETAVVGVPDPIKGLTPIAFVTLQSGLEPSGELEKKIKESVADAVAKIAAPSRIYFTDVMPKTPSGKIMRRLLKEIIIYGKVKGDISGLEDPTVIEKIRALVKKEGGTSI